MTDRRKTFSDFLKDAEAFQGEHDLIKTEPILLLDHD